MLLVAPSFLLLLLLLFSLSLIPLPTLTHNHNLSLSLTPGYIDLSKRRVSPEEIQKCEEKYSKAKTVSTSARSHDSKCV